MKSFNELRGRKWVQVVAAVAVVILANAALVFAQATQADTPVVTQAPRLTSIGAVVAASITATFILKRLLADVGFFNRIPVWMYVTVLSIGFTLFANAVLHTLPGEPFDLIWQGVYNGATASGFRQWLDSGLTKPLSVSAP